MSSRILSMVANGSRIERIRTSAGPIEADAFVAALGSYTPSLLKPLGISVPIYPVKGYSLTLPVLDPKCAPQSTVMDERYKVAITRLGDRIRVGGTAELCGFDVTRRDSRKAPLLNSLKDLFPEVVHSGDDLFWCGLRPMTPDGPPIIGQIGYDNLYVNSGHGTLGWTLACGSARLLSEEIVGHYHKERPL